MDRYPYHRYTILLEATRALAHIGVHIYTSRFLPISNHELLLSVKNLQELGASPFPYIVLIIPRSLPTELFKGEHFVLANLLKSIPGSSSQVEDGQEPQAETDQGALVSPKPAP